MSWKTEWKYLFWIIAGFLACYFLPVGNERFDRAVFEAFHLVKWYAQNPLLLCMMPAFFIAGAIGVFVSNGTVMKYLGSDANKVLAYAVASVSGGILTVCSCTILPIFAGIYRLGAGLGPACVFLYSGPAINVLAIILTARILGPELGIARAAGAIGMSIVIGLLMAFIFRKEEREKGTTPLALPAESSKRSLWQNVLFFAALLGILVFTNCGCSDGCSNIWATIYNLLASLCGIALGVMLVLWFGMKWWKVVSVAIPVVVLACLFPGNILIPFVAALLGLLLITSTDKGECGDWFAASWSSAKEMLPLLLFGILIAGLLLGRTGEEGLIPSEWIAWAVGGNSLRANFFASFAGALMYFATCTEVPIVQALIGAGMGKGPALALLLAGPALSLPSMLIIYNVLGLKKTAVFIGLVIVFSMAFGMIFGCFYP
jgi:uncharacterized membrane protein YraQ (UPF0718 family)